MKKWHIPAELEWRLAVKNPVARRKTFGVIKRWENEAGGFSSHTVESDTIDSINRRFLSGDLSQAEARKEIDLYIEGEYRKAGAIVYKEVSNNDNFKTLDRFFKSKYRNVKIRYKDDAYSAYRRVVLALGQVSIQAASENDIQDALDNHSMNKARGDMDKYARLQRRLIRDCRIMLSWLGRGDVRLHQEPEPDDAVKGLTKSEIHRMVQHLPTEALRVACLMAFYTGCRMGELMALDVGSLNKRTESLSIRRSYSRSGTWGPPKNGKTRNSLIMEEGVELYAKWLSVKDEVQQYRTQISKLVRAACEKAFPGDESRNIKFHDLRHSYAKRLLAEGVAVDKVAEMIGDTIEVCRKHYLGAMDDDALAQVRAQRAAGRRLLAEEG